MTFLRPLLWLLVLFPASAWAFPEGLWYDASRPGEGVTLSEQNDVLALAWYRYDPQGKATFYVGAGALSYETTLRGGLPDMLSRVSGDLFLPQRPQPVAAGRFTLTIDSPPAGVPTATLQVLGETLRLKPYDFALTREIDRFQGLWSLAVYARSDTNHVEKQASHVILDPATRIVQGTEVRGATFPNGRGIVWQEYFTDLGHEAWVMAGDGAPGTDQTFVAVGHMLDDHRWICTYVVADGAGRLLDLPQYCTGFKVAGSPRLFAHIEPLLRPFMDAFPTISEAERQRKALIHFERARQVLQHFPDF